MAAHSMPPGDNLPNDHLYKGARIEKELSEDQTRSSPVLESGSFVDSKAVQTLVALLVASNAIQMGLAADFPHLTVTWKICDNFFTAAFFAEMVAKIWAFRWAYFHDAWNRLDGTLAMLSVFDTWVLQLALLDALHLDFDLRSLSVLRVLRLLRVVRALRLVRSARGLVLVIIGVMAAMRSMIWIALGVLLAVYVGAIFLVGSFSDSMELYPGYTEAPDEIEEMELLQNFNPHVKFGSMFRAMLTLFNVAILAEWSDLVGPIYEKQPLILVFFIGFAFLISLSTMNVVIGMIADSVLENAERMKGEQREREVQTKMTVLRQIRDRVGGIDANGDGKITVNELQARMGTGRAFDDLFKVLESEALHLPRGFSAAELICMLDYNGDGVLEIDEFVGSFYRLIDSGDFQNTCIMQTGINSIKRQLGAHIKAQNAQQDRIVALLTNLAGRSEARAASPRFGATGADGCETGSPSRPGDAAKEDAPSTPREQQDSFNFILHPAPGQDTDYHCQLKIEDIARRLALVEQHATDLGSLRTSANAYEGGTEQHAANLTRGMLPPIQGMPSSLQKETTGRSSASSDVMLKLPQWAGNVLLEDPRQNDARGVASGGSTGGSEFMQRSEL